VFSPLLCPGSYGPGVPFLARPTGITMARPTTKATVPCMAAGTGITRWARPARVSIGKSPMVHRHRERAPLRARCHPFHPGHHPAAARTGDGGLRCPERDAARPHRLGPLKGGDWTLAVGTLPVRRFLLRMRIEVACFCGARMLRRVAVSDRDLGREPWMRPEAWARREPL
jgi:hypothetical protein